MADIILHDCESAIGWTSAGGSIATDTDRQEGSYSLKISSSSNDCYNYYTGSWNILGKTKIRVWVKSTSGTPAGQLYLATNMWGQYSRWDFIWPATWTLMEFDLSSPDAILGGGVDLSNLTTLRFDVDAIGQNGLFDDVRAIITEELKDTNEDVRFLDEISVLRNLNQDIRSIKAVHNDVNQDIRSANEQLKDLNQYISTTKEVLKNLTNDIRFEDEILVIRNLSQDIRTMAEEIEDLNQELRTISGSYLDVNQDIRSLKMELNDINQRIVTAFEGLKNIDQDLRTVNGERKYLNQDARFLLEIPTIRHIPNFIEFLQGQYSAHGIKINRLAVEGGPYQSDPNGIELILDVVGARWVKFKLEETGTWGPWEDFDGRKTINVSSGNGTKKIYCWFKGDVGTFTGDWITSYAYISNYIVEHASTEYVCIANHTSSATTEPGVGVDWETYWEVYLGDYGYTSQNIFIEVFLRETGPVFPTINCLTEEGGSTINDDAWQPDNTPYFYWQVSDYDWPILGYSMELDGDPDRRIEISQPDMLILGFECTKGTRDFEVDYAVGKYYSSSLVAETVADSLLMTAWVTPDAINDRYSIIYLDLRTGLITYRDGEASATPEDPTLETYEIPIYRIIIKAGAVALTYPDDFVDLRNFNMEYVYYTDNPIDEGQHSFKVKAIGSNGIESQVGEFLLKISNQSPNITPVSVYKTLAKLIEIKEGNYTSVTNTPYLEWTDPNVLDGGVVDYYITTDGTEPSVSNFQHTTTNLYFDFTGNPFAGGTHYIKIRARDNLGTYGETTTFTFVYGNEDISSEELILICKGTKYKQVDKDIQIHEITFSLTGARLCTFSIPVKFDSTSSITYGDEISVYHKGNLLFYGEIQEVTRRIDETEERLTFKASGPRAKLNETYWVLDGTSVHEYTINDSLNTRFQDVVKGASGIISNSIGSLPDKDVSQEKFVAITLGSALDNIVERAGPYRYYVTPTKVLTVVDTEANNSYNLYFGVEGEKISVHTHDPIQSGDYNIVANDLNFNITNRYKTCVIEGARKQYQGWFSCACISDWQKGSWELNPLGTGGFRPSNGIEEPTRFRVNVPANVRLLGSLYTGGSAKIKARWKKAARYHVVVGTYYAFESYLYCPKCGWTSVGKSRSAAFQKCPNDGTQLVRKPDGYSYHGLQITYENHHEIVAGGIDVNQRTINCPAYNLIYEGIPTDEKDALIAAVEKGGPGSVSLEGSVPENWCEKRPCIVSVYTAYELAERIKVSVSVSGSAPTDNVLYIVDEGYKYQNNFRNDSSKMTEYAQELLKKYKNININGQIILNGILSDLTLDKTINFQNSNQVDWESVNATIQSITFNFDDNSTTLDLTTEYLG